MGKYSNFGEIIKFEQNWFSMKFSKNVKFNHGQVLNFKTKIKIRVKLMFCQILEKYRNSSNVIFGQFRKKRQS